MTAIVIKEFDGKFFDRLKSAFKGKKTRIVNVGFPASAREPDGTSTAFIAAVHEYGNDHVPQRSFMRTSLEKNRLNYKALNAQNLKKILNGGLSVDAALEQLGMSASSDIKTEIRDGDYVANTEATIKRKGSSRPLINTGQMRQNVTYELEK